VLGWKEIAAPVKLPPKAEEVGTRVDAAIAKGKCVPPPDHPWREISRKTLKTNPKNSTQWSIRQIAEQTGMSKSTVHRVLDWKPASHICPQSKEKCYSDFPCTIKSALIHNHA
jgi:hypothetical protein